VLHVHQINLQTAVGGGEVYTRWFTRALADAGARVTLYVARSNRFWDGLSTEQIEVAPVDHWEQIADRLGSPGAVILTQSRIPSPLAELAGNEHVLTGFSHMPILNRSADEFSRYETVFTVSRYCIGLLRNAGISQVYPEPLYGTGSADRLGNRIDAVASIRSNSPYSWDKRKGRDWLLSKIEPLAGNLIPRVRFKRKPGMTLGIVSLLSPIKQFPLLFSAIAPRIARFPDIALEIFGHGGFAQVRDLRRSLAPIRENVRFWGYQSAVDAIYPNLDYLMTGLPEKEALGLNVLEAQALGTPVLAPNAPPFTETVLHEKTGFLYRDPREDAGKDFGDLLGSLVAGRSRPNPAVATHHLQKFSYQAMVRRACGVVEHLKRAQGIQS
jgi:glycosyltransferase involved in cell wall biosynthesis